MILNSKNGNGGTKKPADFKDKQIEFPVTYRLKAVMIGTENDDENKLKLTQVFSNLDIPYKYHDKRVSSGGAYVSFTYIVNKEQMDQLYADLKEIKELKFAV